MGTKFFFVKNNDSFLLQLNNLETKKYFYNQPTLKFKNPSSKGDLKNINVVSFPLNLYTQNRL